MKETPEERPGIKSTEFWMMVIGALLSVGVAFGWITEKEAAEATEQSKNIIESLMMLISTVAPSGLGLYYAKKRTEIKRDKIQQQNVAIVDKSGKYRKLPDGYIIKVVK